MNAIIKVKNKFNSPFISLRQKNFKYYWIGMCISLIGTWMHIKITPQGCYFLHILHPWGIIHYLSLKPSIKSVTPIIR